MTGVISKILALIVRLYQMIISPLFPNSCRYHPSCSEYTRQAIISHGPIKGIGLGAWRILRCNPWSKGGHDPVPNSNIPCGIEK
jgi:putative membrane protein insertion efficiency factor